MENSHFHDIIIVVVVVVVVIETLQHCNFAEALPAAPSGGSA